MLFQEKILVHESYFFDSTLLAKHIQGAKGEPSLFELAAMAGLIVPAFRFRGTTGLEQAYDAMKQENVYGQSYELLHPEMQPFRDRVIGSVDEGLRQARPFYWPSPGKQSEDLGEGYYRVVRELLQTEEPPDYVQRDSDRGQLFARVWETSKAWRYDCVEKAARRTKKKGASGLQRAELLYSIGQLLGMPADVRTIRVADLVGRCEDDEQALCMEVFLKWVTQCHHLNQARTFGTAINFPVYNVDRDFMLDTLLRSSLDPGPLPSEGFRCEVCLPGLATLLKTGSRDLIAIRGDLGVGYLVALRRWQENPSSDNQAAVKKSLRNYCDQICSRYERTVLQPVVASFNKGPSPPVKILGTGIGTGITLAGGHAGGLFVTVAKAAYTAYRYIRGERLKTRRSPRSRELELTLGSHAAGVPRPK